MHALMPSLRAHRPTNSTSATPSTTPSHAQPVHRLPPTHRSSCATRAALTDAPARTAAPAPTGVPTPPGDHDQLVREGHYEAALVARQADKGDPEQPLIASILPRFEPKERVVDHIIVGCGPAGLALAAEVAAHGISVALLGRDAPFVNNYGVWEDEFTALGLQDTLDCTWDDAACWFGEGQEGEVRVGRRYGRVCRRRLRSALLARCQKAGVLFLPCHVDEVQQADGCMALRCREEGSNQQHVARCRLVTLASGAAAGRFLQYEQDAPRVAAQTAYGIEADVTGYGEAYDDSVMLFMDFRRHHSGVWPQAAPRLRPGEHPNAGDGLWGTAAEVPSFLYAMPLGNGRVFLEETCLVAKPALPFAVLKRRLHRRLAALGIAVHAVHEEEWSYIPVGGPLPLSSQPITAFGAAANLVHPATGYSIARSLREAPALGAQVAAVLRRGEGVEETAQAVWQALWSAETRRQAAFHVFGMELLCQLDLAATEAFFITFFRLPPSYWRGFLASSLSSTQLLTFALLTFVLAPPAIQAKLVAHLLTHPAGRYLVQRYTGGASGRAGVAVAHLERHHPHTQGASRRRRQWQLQRWRCWRVM